VRLLAFCEHTRRIRVGPPKMVPVIHVLAQYNQICALNGLLSIDLFKKLVCGRATRTTFRREEFEQHRNLSARRLSFKFCGGPGENSRQACELCHTPLCANHELATVHVIYQYC